MAYRNGTYIAFHAGGTTDPIASDIKYYRLLKAWHEHDDIEFAFINSHDKVSAVRDSSKKGNPATQLNGALEQLEEYGPYYWADYSFRYRLGAFRNRICCRSLQDPYNCGLHGL